MSSTRCWECRQAAETLHAVRVVENGTARRPILCLGCIAEARARGARVRVGASFQTSRGATA